jgi:hypothetical protein
MADSDPRPYCAVKPKALPILPPDLHPGRSRAIIQSAGKWANGTVLHYYFFDRDTDGGQVTLEDGSTQFVSWVGADEQRDVVRWAFQEWKKVGMGLEFDEVGDRSDAEVRIGFDPTDGSWSYVGRDVLGIGANERTMNFGWDLTDDYGHTTALHEIGHTFGMPHEHQNPFAGIVWDEEKVYATLGGPPNSWPREQTFNNVLRKLDTSDVEGSTWDPDSVMEYDFPGGLILEPAEYRGGIHPPGGLSTVDRQFVLKWYPGIGEDAVTELAPFTSTPLALKAGEQADFAISPPASRRYKLATFGTADTVLVLFEDVDGQLRYVRGDDDSGQDRNAQISVKLFRGRKYVARLRLYWAGESGETAVMYW